MIAILPTINATLKVGSTSTTVEVAATLGAELQTSNATVGSTLTSDALGWTKGELRPPH